MTVWILGLKFVIDIGATVALACGEKLPMALMFAGFALADVGAWWMALK